MRTREADLDDRPGSILSAEAFSALRFSHRGYAVTSHRQDILTMLLDTNPSQENSAAPVRWMTHRTTAFNPIAHSEGDAAKLNDSAVKDQAAYGRLENTEVTVVTIMKPYWAIASLVAASCAIAVLITLVATVGVEPLAGGFLGFFGAGLGTSSLGYLITSPRVKVGTVR
jgi:hypothetical protein